MNKIKLAGTIESEITVFTKTKNGNLLEFYVSSKRNSGVEDTLRVLAKEELFVGYEKGDKIFISGEVKTRNKDGHLLIYIYAKEISDRKERDMDIVEIDGFICSKKPIRTTTLTEQKIMDLMLSVNNENGSSYIPCIFWNKMAENFKDVEVGTELKLKGRLQSREYAKVLNETQFEIRTAYELSVFDVEKVEDK